MNTSVSCTDLQALLDLIAALSAYGNQVFASGDSAGIALFVTMGDQIESIVAASAFGTFGLVKDMTQEQVALANHANHLSLLILKAKH